MGLEGLGGSGWLGRYILQCVAESCVTRKGGSTARTPSELPGCRCALIFSKRFLIFRPAGADGTTGSIGFVALAAYRPDHNER